MKTVLSSAAAGPPLRPGAESDPGEEQDEGDMDLDRGSAEAANGDRPAHRSASCCGAPF